MGLDSVELVMRFEEVFGITIDDKEAEKLVTPRDVIELVLAKVERSGERACLNQRAFHLLRRVFKTSFSTRRRCFMPDAELQALVPMKNRRATWSCLASQIGITSLPDLARPRWVHLFIWSTSCFLGFAFSIAVTKPENWWRAFSE